MRANHRADGQIHSARRGSRSAGLTTRAAVL